MYELTDRPRDLLALLWRKDRPVDKLAIFVHGFRGNYLTTWGGLGNLLRYGADSKPVFEDWDYLFLGYETSKVTTYLDIAGFIWTEWRKAARGDAPYEHSYKTLALFGHSLGTLGIRQALCAHSKQPANMLSALHGVTYFGSPVNGSPLAKLAIPWPISSALKPGSPQLRMLKGWVEDVHAHAPWPRVRVVTGIDDKVVGYRDAELMQWAGDAYPPDLTQADHSGLIKADGWNTMIIDYIKSCLK